MIAVDADKLDQFAALCERERCPYAVVGAAFEAHELVVEDPLFENKPVDLPMSVLFGKAPKMHRSVDTQSFTKPIFDSTAIDIAEAAERILRLPSVASKSFLITIGDRSITGMVTRDQMVGPWQVPVADVAVTAPAFDTYHGEAMAMGERTPVALLSHGASARFTVGEALTNIAAANIGDSTRIKLSAKRMAAASHPGGDAGW